MNWNPPLRISLMLLVVAALLPTFGVNVYNDWQLRQERQLEVERQARSLAELVSNELQQTAIGMAQMLTAVANAPVVQFSGAECGGYLARIADAFPFISSIGITDAKGGVTCLDTHFSRPLSISDRAHFIMARDTGRFSIGRVFVGRVTGHKVIGFAQPIVNADSRQFSGVVFGSIRLDLLAQRLSTMPALQGARLILTDETGAIAVSLPAGNTDGTLPQGWIELAARSKGGVVRGSASEGEHMVFAYVPHTVPPVGLALWVGVDRSKAMAALNAVQHRNVMVHGSALIVGILLALLIWRKLVERPFGQILQVTKAVRRGNLKARTGLRPDNEITQVAKALDDVLDDLAVQMSRRDAAEQQVRAARDEALRISAGKTAFLAAASHDLRQPLQTISLIGQLMKAGQPISDGTKLAGTLGRAVQDMGKMLDQLADIAQLEQGQLVADIKATQLSRILRTLRDEFTPIAEQNRVQFSVEVEDDWIWTDAAMLLRIMRNLLHNAVKFTPANGDIALRIERRVDSIALSVADTGIGIRKEQQDEIFLEFRQLANPERDRRKGFGLGLAIVERLCGLLQHTITVSSTPGAGSTFTVEVPRAMSEPIEESRHLPPEAMRLEGRILVVEDDESIAQTTRAVLAGRGASVEIAETGEKALALLQREAFDAVLSDHRLPGQSGAEVLAYVRANAPATIRVLITGDALEELNKLASEGEFEILRKPVTDECLVSALRPLAAPVDGSAPI